VTSRLALNPANVAAESAEFSRRLAMAAATLATIDVRGDACTPRREVMRRGKAVLWHYPRKAGGVSPVPLVICYALVNRPTMLDLQPDRSLIRKLTALGFDIYLVDWGYPDRADSGLTLDDYVSDQLSACVDHVCAAHGIPAVNLLGVCQGGTLSLLFTALYPARVRNLVTMVTPVDFHTADNLLSAWVRRLDVDRLVARLGNVPGAVLNAAFLGLMPLRLTVGKYASLAEMAGDRAALENFLRMERWIHDSPDQAGSAFREFVGKFFQQNLLMHGGLEVGGRVVEPRRITCPILNVYALRDHLVPPAASRALEGLTDSRDYSTFEFDGGHIGIYVSRSAQELLPSTIAQWLGSR
jgi:polyhydroxyalkanoate synthase